jgi:hypothetical protein
VVNTIRHGTSTYVCYREDGANVHAAGLCEEDKASEVTNGMKTVVRNMYGKRGKL